MSKSIELNRLIERRTTCGLVLKLAPQGIFFTAILTILLKLGVKIPLLNEQATAVFPWIVWFALVGFMFMLAVAYLLDQDAQTRIKSIDSEEGQ